MTLEIDFMTKNSTSRLNQLFGPLVWWELVRLARKGDMHRARTLLLYSLFLATVLFAFWWSFPASPISMFFGPAGFAGKFVDNLALVLLEAQLLLVFAITPAYAAAAIAEEKDRRTLALLLTTELTDREIVWGKAVARVLFVLMAVAAGIPVLALTLLFGGVSMEFLLAGYALTTGTVILCAAIGVSAACHAPDSRGALIRAYSYAAAIVAGVLIPPLVLLSPFAMLVYHSLEMTSGVLRALFGFAYPIGQTLIACAIMVEATRNLRRAGPAVDPPQPTAYPEPPRGRAVLMMPIILDHAPEPLPPVDDADPVLWKERQSWRTPSPILGRTARLLGAVFTIAAVTLFAIGGFRLIQRAIHALDPLEAEKLLSRGPQPPDPAGSMLIAAGVFASGLYLVPLAVGVTGCIARERFRQTLDMLLATPLSRWHMLRSKVKAHTERGLAFAGGAAAALGAGFGADGGAWFGLAALVAYATGVGMVLGLSTWLSVRCATPVRAFRLCMPAVVAVVSLPVLVWYLTQWEDTTRSVEALAWTAGAFALVGVLFWWRAGVELERGE
jgi:ABC-type transport system involved in multi-copper enzyme maturation permease subunit